MIATTKPLIRSAAAHVAPASATPVLVIDDDLAGATATCDGLAAAGYQTAAETRGDAVLQLVRAELLRLVVSELYVPCAEGPCVVMALRADRAWLPQLRVLAHSRHTAAADDAWALAAGCDGVLHKPAAAAALVREVRRLDGNDAVEPDVGPGAATVAP